MNDIFRDLVRTDAGEGRFRLWEVSGRKSLAKDVLAEPGRVDDDVIRESTIFKVNNLQKFRSTMYMYTSCMYIQLCHLSSHG